MPWPDAYVQYAGDIQVVALVAEEDPVILRAEADQGWVDVP